MQNNRQITISTAGSRHATSWPASVIWWSEFVEKLRTPVRSTETVNEYLGLAKSQQDDLKDVGGFVGGSLASNRRKAGCIQGRDILTLDLDNIPAGRTQDTLLRLEGLSCAYAVYSTRKHRPDAPRLRVVFPCNRPATADEYEPLCRKLAALVGIELCDPTTFQVHRLMYWPSCCSDGEYIFHYADKAFLDVDGVLGMYNDWRDISEWPQVPGTPTHAKLAAKQGNPLEKPGVVGAFCRVYDIYAAMEKFLPGIYEQTAASDRFTYSGGSTTGGAVVYDDGLFLYSHHATDPCGSRLVNAFDLVRLHKFDELDDDVKAGTPMNRLPSYAEMSKFAIADEQVAGLLNKERLQQAQADFDVPICGDDNTDWIKQLELHPRTGFPEKTFNNVKLIIQNDPLLKGRIRLDLFADAYMAQCPLPWELRKNDTKIIKWIDKDDNGLQAYLERVYKIRSGDVVSIGLSEAAASLAYDPVLEYLENCQWDGRQRLETLYIDYLGAEDTPYTRAVTRKAFVAAVARAYNPGTKFDNMTIVCGPQGIGKSTLFARMGGEWFSDSIRTFEGKDASELLQGIWICEISEMEAFSKIDIRAVKSFLSKTDDQYRAAYARKTEKHLRRCVFFGTTNDHDYLKDTTGNRRFWPIDAQPELATKSIFDDLTSDVVAQLWAEAVILFRQGEQLYLPRELEDGAERQRQSHFDVDPLQGQIEAWLDEQVPIDWAEWDLNRRRTFWNGQIPYAGQLIQRDKVCVMEVLRECIGDGRANIPLQDSKRVSRIMDLMPEWERASTLRFGGGYGRQRGFRRAGVNGSVNDNAFDVNGRVDFSVNGVNGMSTDNNLLPMTPKTASRLEN